MSRLFSNFSYNRLIYFIAEYLFNRNLFLFNVSRKVYRSISWTPKLAVSKLHVKIAVEPINQKTIYLVNQRFSRVNVKTGIPRVESYFFTKLVENKNLSFRVLPVFWDGKYFIIDDEEYSKQKFRMFSRKRIWVWNPVPNDILYIQTFSLLDTFNQDELKMFKNECKIVMNIYDILPVTNPEWFKNYQSSSFERLFDLSLRFSNYMIVNSSESKSNIESYVARNRHKYDGQIPSIQLVNLWSVAAPSSDFLQKSQNNPKNILFTNSDPILLLLSTVEPRKGHKELIKAANEVWRQNVKFNLLFIGQLGWISEDFKDEFDDFLSKNTHRVRWFNNVDDYKLEEYLAISSILISPSLGEGYGLPVSEALQRGIPVVANSIPPYKEWFGTHAVLYGSGEHFTSLTEALLNLDEVLATSRDMIPIAPMPDIDTIAELNEILIGM